jgi:hypothetical protein
MTNTHSESGDGEELLIFRCSECGKTSVSLGWLHGNHIQKHHGWGPWNIIPNPRTFGNFDAHMEYTEILRVEGYSEVSLEEVDPFD